MSIRSFSALVLALQSADHRRRQHHGTGQDDTIGPAAPRQVGSAAAAGTLGRRPGRCVGRSHRGWQAGSTHQRGDLNFASSNQPAAMEASEDSFLGLHADHLDDMDSFQ